MDANQDSLALDTDLTGIAHILRDLTLEVPPYQRNYSWAPEQVQEFWDDLRAALAIDRPSYFMGTVVLSRGNGDRMTVIDGQQRLATASLVLAAITAELVRRGEDQRADTISARYLATTSLRENAVLPRLLLNEADRGAFEAIVRSPGTWNPTESVSRPRISAAFQRLSASLKDDIDGYGPAWVDRLLRWIDLLDTRAKVITVTVADDADAFMIFETLNDRGLELTVGDVIKNYLLSLSRSDIDRAQDDWLTMNHALEENSPKVEPTTFIRHYWSAHFGATRERELYKSIRSEVKSAKESTKLLSDLAYSAPVYSMLLNPGHEFWTMYPSRTRQNAATLVELGLEQQRPLALAVIEDLDPLEADATFSAIVAWSVRGLIVGGIGGGVTERAYAEAAVRVTNHRSGSVFAIAHDLEVVVADDSEFLTAFAQRRVLRTSYYNYYLRALAAHDLAPGPTDEETVAVGLFPRVDNDLRWAAHLDEEDRSNLAYRLGNFALISRSQARDLPVDPSARFEFLREHDLLDFGQSTWTEISRVTVDERQQAMAELAIHVWPKYPPEVSDGRD